VFAVADDGTAFLGYGPEVHTWRLVLRVNKEQLETMSHIRIGSLVKSGEVDLGIYKDAGL
jgi:hypothetical protein